MLAHTHDRLSYVFGAVAAAGGAVSWATQSLFAAAPHITHDGVAQWVLTLTSASSAVVGSVLLGYTHWRKTLREAKEKDDEVYGKTWEGKYQKLEEHYKHLQAEERILAEEIKRSKELNGLLVSQIEAMREQASRLNCPMPECGVARCLANMDYLRGESSRASFEKQQAKPAQTESEPP